MSLLNGTREAAALLDGARRFGDALDTQRDFVDYLATEHITVAALLYPEERPADVLRRLSWDDLLVDLMTRTVEANARAEGLRKLAAQRRAAWVARGQTASNQAEMAAMAQMLKPKS